MFPALEPFRFGKTGDQIQVGNHQYAAHLTCTEPELLAGVVNAGMVKTDILRYLPVYPWAVAAVIGPVVFNSVEESARNAVDASL
ncbi:hypothetical protein [Streptomyces sp. PSKA30]|uniref:hypothetical protein n=1 Tax=Streptomyces sp. PSKA30 TaxID=2874597 RepID=UPI001CD0F382|nr:hypothetical protein [Streptomyces sp. PSKA30]MBZ9638424.1 hypothetical protein [Streptomyces sp. PSKA30]